MKMFASDLDRTLIYSNRALAEFKQDDNRDLIGVEHRNNEEVAFMTRKAFECLKVVADNLLFVPVTTRTYEQFSRISIFRRDIPLTYAVTSNGANIIYKGMPLMDWKAVVQNRLEKECACLDEMIAKVKEFPIKGTLKKAEDLFFYYILDKELTLDVKDLIKSMAKNNGWRVSIQGRKLYLMPKPVCKGEAVMFIKEREGINTLFGAGDSLLDYDFLKVCDYPLVPSHGELVKEKIIEHFLITEKWGVQAGEEILLLIATILNVGAYSR